MIKKLELKLNVVVMQEMKKIEKSKDKDEQMLFATTLHPSIYIYISIEKHYKRLNIRLELSDFPMRIRYVFFSFLWIVFELEPFLFDATKSLFRQNSL